MKEEQGQHEINLVLDEDRYNNLLEMCGKYKEQQARDITPNEYILMLIDSALGDKQEQIETEDYIYWENLYYFCYTNKLGIVVNHYSIIPESMTSNEGFELTSPFTSNKWDISFLSTYAS